MKPDISNRFDRRLRGRLCQTIEKQKQPSGLGRHDRSGIVGDLKAGVILRTWPKFKKRWDAGSVITMDKWRIGVGARPLPKTRNTIKPSFPFTRTFKDLPPKGSSPAFRKDLFQR